MRLGSILKNRVVHNAGWIIAGRVYHMLGSFLISLLTARFLGPGNFGLINYAATYTTFFASFCSLDIHSIIVKNFVDHPEEEGETIGSAISYTVVCAYKFGLLFTGKSVAWFAVSTSIDHLLAGLVLVLVYRRLEGPRFRASLGKAKQLLSSSHHFNHNRSLQHSVCPNSAHGSSWYGFPELKPENERSGCRI